MVSCPGGGVTQPHKLGQSKAAETDSLPVLEAHKSAMKMLAGSYALWGSGETIFLPLLVSRTPGFHWPVAAELCLCSVLTWPSSLCLPVAPLFLRRTPVIEFRVHP